MEKMPGNYAGERPGQSYHSSTTIDSSIGGGFQLGAAHDLDEATVPEGRENRLHAGAMGQQEAQECTRLFGNETINV